MVIVQSKDLNYKIVSLGSEGWFFYTPPLHIESTGIFISLDDPVVKTIAEELKLEAAALPKSTKAAEMLLQRLINIVEEKRRTHRKPTILAAV